MNTDNRQWLLKRRPIGRVKESDFELAISEPPQPQSEEILIRNTWLAFDPAMRGWIDDKPNYFPPVEIGEVMRGMTVGEVVHSNNNEYKKGDIVTGMLGWQDYAISNSEQIRKTIPNITPEASLSIFGITGLTAYFGLLEKGQPQEGDVIVISGAAGAT